MRTQPLPLRFFCQAHAFVVEPLILAVVVIAANHFTIADLLANTVQVLIIAVFVISTVSRAILLTTEKG